MIKLFKLYRNKQIFKQDKGRKLIPPIIFLKRRDYHRKATFGSTPLTSLFMFSLKAIVIKMAPKMP